MAEREQPDPGVVEDAEFWLRESQRVARLGTYHLDIPSGIWHCTEALDDLFGISTDYPKTVQGWADIVHPDDRAEMSRYFLEEVLGERSSFDREYRIVRPIDGRERWVYGRGELIIGAGGDPVAMIGTIQDVTERMETEQALRLEEDRFRALFESAVEAIVVVAEDGTIRMANSRAFDQFGYRREELVGRSLGVLIPEDVRASHRGLEESFMADPARSRRMGSNATLRALRKDGSEFPVEISLTSVETPTGRYAMAIVVDVTERERSQAELRTSLQLLRESDAKRRELVSRLVDAQEEERKRIADDIHDDSIQIMSAAAMRVSALKGMMDSERSVEILEKLEETIDLAISRLRHLVFDLRPRILDEIGLAPALLASLEGQKGSLDYSVEDRLEREPPPEARAAMFRVALEAVANARKHGGASTVKLDLEQADGGSLLRVTDDGEGFDTTRPREGGLGLATMQERAESGGGWLKVRSSPGAGTSVEFWLPDGFGAD